MNLLAETLELLKQNGKGPADVRWVGKREPHYIKAIRPTPEPEPHGSWDDFERFANIDYDDGYGGAEISTDLVIVGDDWWLERGEYDGSEWWEFKTLPMPPKETMPLRASDLMDRL